MSTHPRTPAPATPGPGKLPLPELLEMKRRGEKITVLTAYDSTSARLADEAASDPGRRAWFQHRPDRLLEALGR